MLPAEAFYRLNMLLQDPEIKERVAYHIESVLHGATFLNMGVQQHTLGMAPANSDNKTTLKLSELISHHGPPTLQYPSSQFTSLCVSALSTCNSLMLSNIPEDWDAFDVASLLHGCGTQRILNLTRINDRQFSIELQSAHEVERVLQLNGTPLIDRACTVHLEVTAITEALDTEAQAESQGTFSSRPSDDDDLTFSLLAKLKQQTLDADRPQQLDEGSDLKGAETDVLYQSILHSMISEDHVPGTLSDIDFKDVGVHDEEKRCSSDSTSATSGGSDVPEPHARAGRPSREGRTKWRPKFSSNSGTCESGFQN